MACTIDPKSNRVWVEPQPYSKDEEKFLDAFDRACSNPEVREKIKFDMLKNFCGYLSHCALNLTSEQFKWLCQWGELEEIEMLEFQPEWYEKQTKNNIAAMKQYDGPKSQKVSTRRIKYFQTIHPENWDRLVAFASSGGSVVVQNHGTYHVQNNQPLRELEIKMERMEAKLDMLMTMLGKVDKTKLNGHARPEESMSDLEQFGLDDEDYR